MKMISAALAALVVLLAQPIAAQEALPWTRAEMPSGTAAMELPCNEAEAFVGGDETSEVASCALGGLEIVLLVMPEQDWDIEGVTDSPFEQTREQLRTDPNTTYLTETQFGGAPAFYGEGRSSKGLVGTVMVDLSGDRLLVVLVHSDGSAAAEANFSSIYARALDTLEVAPQ